VTGIMIAFRIHCTDGHVVTTTVGERHANMQ
jgi:hypothetical protein